MQIIAKKHGDIKNFSVICEIKVYLCTENNKNITI